MLIIVEGVDGAGKSTLVRRLAQTITTTTGDAVQILHRGPPELHPIDEYERPLWSYRPGSGHIIADRWHLGELVYPQVVGRTTKLDAGTLRHIELLLASRGASVIHVTAELNVLRDRLVARGDDLITPDMLAEIKIRYAYVMSKMTTLPRSTYYGDPSESTLNKIVETLLKHDEDVRTLNDFVTYVGTTTPDLLLYGDVRGPGSDRSTAPAFGPYPNTSGNYLLNALEETRLESPALSSHRDWNRIGIANACDVDDPLTLWNRLGQPRAVALGVNAHRRLDERGIPHLEAPHPQYWRRFHHHEQLGYGRYLMGHTEELSWR